MESIRLGGSEDPQRHPEKLAGDKGYSSNEARAWLRQHCVEPVIAHRDNESGRHAEDFDRESYRDRNIVERCIGWLKEHRRIATRYEKLAVNYLGMLNLGMVLMYLKF